MKHAILITGSSSGIGQGAAIELAGAGHQVFAGVRKEADGEKLKKQSSLIIPIIIDVVNSSSIDSAFNQIAELRDPSRPFSLINNAGIAVAGPMEAMKPEILRRQFEINFFGLMDVTQKFLPWIRDTKGRIVNVSSIGGRVSSPFLGAYSASKFALEAISDSMRQELDPFGVKVIILEPGPIQTEIWRKGIENREEVENYCYAEKLKPYRARYERFEKFVRVAARRAIPVDNVSKKVRSAVECANPPVRIVVAPMQSRIELMFAEWLPTKAYDMMVRKYL